MSRKTARNASKNESKKTARLLSLGRTTCSKIGFSGLALGSLTLAAGGLAHGQNAQNAPAAGGTNANGAANAQQPSTRTRGRAAQPMAASAAQPRAAKGALPAKADWRIPANGSGLLAQASPSATATQANGAGLVAQNTAAANQSVTVPVNSAQQLQEIVVTGIRGSLERSLQIKKMSLGVVDAVSAEQIGQFPDASIGQAIGRLPGITVDRGDINYQSAAGAPTSTGQVQGVTVDGFGPQFQEMLIDGRQVASGNGQTFNFSQFSANYVGEVDVLKTPDFSLSSGAVGGTINVKMPNPFDNPGRHLQAFYQENDSEMNGGFRPSFGALLSDTFDDGKFGILIDGDYSDQHITGHHEDVVGWKGSTGFSCADLSKNYTTPFGSTGCATVGPGATGNSAAPVWYPQDMAMYLEQTDQRTKDGRVSLQWHPTDNVLVTLDDNYSSWDEHIDRWQRSTWFGEFLNTTLDGNGTITSFDDNGPTDFNAFIANNYITTNTPGVNVVWDINDQWTAELDADQSVSAYNPNDDYTDIDADEGYGDTSNNYYGGLVTSTNSNVLPYWSAYGPGSAAPGQTGTGTFSGATPADYLGLNPFIVGSHDLPVQSQTNREQINEAKLLLTWNSSSGTKVNFGSQFSDDLWNAKEMDTFTNTYWEEWAGYGPASDNLNGNGVRLPASDFTAVGVTPWLPGFQGNSKLPSSIVLFNPYTILQYLIHQPLDPAANAAAEAAGYPPYPGGVIPAEVLSPTSVQHVSRQNYAPFVTATQSFPLGSMKLNARLGLRYEKTDETIAGLAAPLTGVTWLGTGDATAYGFVLGTRSWTTTQFNYGYFLPSLDLNLWTTPQFEVRFDYSRTENEPPNGDLIPNTTYGGRVNALTATGNNPELLPYLSDNFDLGVAWYYASNDYVSVDGFVKRVSNFPTSSVTPLKTAILDPAPCTDPENGNALSASCGKDMTFADSTYTNAASATVDGVAATWQQMLPLGFGFQVNGTIVHTNANFNPYDTTSNQFALPGIGDSANLITFYQAHGFQARLAVQWQGNQLLFLGQEQSGGAFGAEPVNLAASTEVDYSMQYAFTHYLQGYFEALNLNDSEYHTYGRFEDQTLNVVEYGRSFEMGVRLKF
ncbi:MAG: TonB-dependent receptor [Steroidobacteraceae bacterium]